MPYAISGRLFVNNVPIYTYQKDYKFWVVRLVDGELWFYGAYDEKETAKDVAKEIGNGLAIENPEIEDKKRLE